MSHDARPDGRRTLAPSQPCECLAWGSRDVQMVLLTDHHERCPQRGDDRGHWLALVTSLVRGMEGWASDEDGIHPSAWESYRRAKALIGETTSEVEA